MTQAELPTVARKQVLQIFAAGVQAADPFLAVKHCLLWNKQELAVRLSLQNNLTRSFSSCSKVHIIAFGKAACAMSEAAVTVIPEHLLVNKGIAVTNYENMRAVPKMQVIGAGHPLPDLAGLNAAQLIANRVAAVEPNELILVLISGGGSALLPAPHPMITLADKLATTRLLLESGATINEINCVRKHLSILKGGGLARLAAKTQLHALVLSDVIDDDVSAIASGPTVPDATTFADALAILKAKQLLDQIPRNVQRLLLAGVEGEYAETPKPNDIIFVNTAYTLIGSNAISVGAAIGAAKAARFETSLYSKSLAGEARVVAGQLAQYVRQLLLDGLNYPIALVAGGETTVTVTGQGRGGRNQEFALAFALAAERLQLPPCWTLLSAGTDGRDGPTDAAGGLVDSQTLACIRLVDQDPLALLANNDAYTALQYANGLLKTGTTGTNVADLLILLIYP